MSYLDKQFSAFKSNLTSSSHKLSNKRTAAAAASSTPLPAPSQTSITIKPDLKRKRVEQANTVFSQPKDTGTGSHIITQVTYALEKLKEKDVLWTWQRLCEYLSLHGREKGYGQALKKILMRHDKVNYKKVDGKEKDEFSFRPIHNIRSPDELLGYLQSQPTAQALSVKDLKDGWQGALDAIDNLEKQGKLAVTRHKKDDSARFVWPNDPSLFFSIDQEFKSMWQKIKLPEPGALADELEREGLTPANKSRSVKAKPVKQESKTKRARKGGKTTNTHMAGVLRDYSHLKK
ncbi:MAG: hypothetical protein ASARMPREDX12_001346 [Alectoria sarmentosa]|nr:MAG: hypothetical protein ASARMPREDX12_001346 [Alectoria sarmentosa]